MGREWRHPDESAAKFAQKKGMQELALDDLSRLGKQGHWVEGPFLIFDTETTGVNLSEDRIVTAAIYTEIAGQRWQRSWLINPERMINPMAQKVNKISNEYVIEKGLIWTQAIPEIAEYLLTAVRSGFKLVAYNAHFDFTVLDANLKQLGLSGLFAQEPETLVIDPYVIDRGLDRFRKGKRKLVNLLDFYYPDLGSVELHNALMDCFYTNKILTKVLSSFPELMDWEKDQVMKKQRELYKMFQERLQDYFRSQGRTNVVDTVWL